MRSDLDIRVERFNRREHLAPLLDVLARVKALSGYPLSVGPSDGIERFEKWLLSGKELGRWVAIRNGEVVGHVLLCKPHNYFSDRFGEVEKHFVDPSARKHGVGSTLLRTAGDEARSLSRQPALMVMTSAVEAIRLYADEGFATVCEYDGSRGYGHNFVMLNLEHPQPPGQVPQTRGTARV